MIPNYIQGEWHQSAASTHLTVLNPATAEELCRVPLCGADEVEQATQAAARAFPAWRRTPVMDRVQYLFQLKALLEQSFEDISLTITKECGKTIGESRGELRRAI